MAFAFHGWYAGFWRSLEPVERAKLNILRDISLETTRSRPAPSNAYNPIDPDTMPPKSRFARLDAFTKTVEDARIRTRLGGVVTISALFVIFFLIWGEWSEYRRIVVLPELVVDKGRGMLPFVEEVCAELNLSY